MEGQFLWSTCQQIYLSQPEALPFEFANLHVVASEIRAQGPESRPVSDAILTNNGQAKAALDPHLAAFSSNEICPLCLNSCRSPARAGLDGRDLQSAIATEPHIGGVRGVRLDLSRSPVRSSSGIGSSRRCKPVGRVRERVLRAHEVVTPSDLIALKRRHNGADCGQSVGEGQKSFPESHVEM